MTKKTPEPKSTRARANFLEPVTITPADAFIAYAEMPKPSIYSLEKILREKGVKVSTTTLFRWQKKHDWDSKVGTLANKGKGLSLLELGSAAQALKALANEGKEFDIVSSVKGLESRVVRLMADKLMQTKDAEEPAYFIKLTELLSDLEDVKRKGFQADVQTGTRPMQPVEEPKVEAKPAPEVPKLAEVHLATPFTRIGKK